MLREGEEAGDEVRRREGVESAEGMRSETFTSTTFAFVRNVANARQRKGENGWKKERTAPNSAESQPCSLALR